MRKLSSIINPRNYAHTLDHLDGKEVKAVVQQTATDIDQVRVATQQTAADVDQVKRLSSNLIGAHYRDLFILLGNQLLESIHRWLSPPDPSTNHNIACGTHHKKTASWFFQGNIFQEWKSTGSLLWIHGKRLPRSLSNLTLSNIVLFYSGLGQERFLVCTFLIVLVENDRRLLSVPR